MAAFVARRLLAAIPVLLGVSVLVFSMLHLVPGDPVRLMFSELQTTPEQVEQVRRQLGLDDPLPVQYARFVGNAVQGDLGDSIRLRRPVASLIMDNMRSTLELALAGLLVSALLGIPLGILSAIKRNSWVGAGSMVFALIGISMPSFWLGLLFIFVFSLHLKLLPSTGAGDLQHLILPAITLGLTASALIARLTRSSMLEVLNNEYVTTARSKGLSEFTVIIRHALRNALIPVVTIFGLQFGQLIAGAVVVETVFGRPGIGRLVVDAILAKDFPVVQGVVLVIAVGYVIVNVVVDLLYGVLDPRIRLS